MRTNLAALHENDKVIIIGVEVEDDALYYITVDGHGATNYLYVSDLTIVGPVGNTTSDWNDWFGTDRHSTKKDYVTTSDDMP